MSSQEISEKIGKNIIKNNKHGRNQEVYKSLINIEAHEPRSTGANKSCNDDPAKEPELIFQKSLLETYDKAQKSNDNKTEADEVVIEEKLANKIVLDAKIRQFGSNKFAQLIVVVGQEDEPVDIFGHWNFHLLLLIPLYIVELYENHQT